MESPSTSTFFPCQESQMHLSHLVAQPLISDTTINPNEAKQIFFISTFLSFIVSACDMEYRYALNTKVLSLFVESPP
jgi:hypothetical protein